MTSNKVALAVLVTAIVLSVVVLYFSLTLSSHGTIKTIGVECDVTEIDWGSLSPNDTAQVTIHVWNNGTVPVTNLSLSVGNWNPPAASSYMAISWNYDGSPVTSTQKAIVLSLHVASNIQGIVTFSNDLTITAQG